ncbi:MAG: trigger factor [Proteobacteria bacterium]|nr:trigger factor [Pseudomonadota bacterium]
MSFEIVEKNQVVREITVTVPGDAVRRIEGKLVESARKTLKMNGFRAGKVPAHIIRQKAGASIMEDARRESLQVSVREALDTLDNLLHVSEVEIVVPQTEDGGFVAKLNAEIKPVLEATNYKGLEVSVPDAVVTDDDVMADLEKRRERNAVIEPVEDRTVVEDGDVVMTTLSAPNAAAEKICRAGDRQITLGKGYFNEEMEKCLIGATLHEPLQLTAKINDEEAIVTCVVNEIKKRVLPALDDAFALDTGDAETLDGLKEVTRKRLMEEAEKNRDEQIENKLLEVLRAQMPIDMPEGYVKARAAQAIRLQLEQMMRQQINDDMLDRIIQNIRPEELEEYRVDYHNEIILNAVAAAEKIEVSEEDTIAEAKKWFQNIDESKVKQWLKTNNAAEFVGEQVKRDRALDIIKAAAIIKKEEAVG